MFPRRRLRSVVQLEHPTGCKVSIALPADMETVGEAIQALGEKGFVLPAARGARTMTLTTDQGTITIPLATLSSGSA